MQAVPHTVRTFLPVLAILAYATQLFAQFPLFRPQVDGRFELSDAVDVKDLPNEAATHLARVDALLADEKWDEAVETLRSVAESHGSRVLELAPRRFINVRDYCHIRIGSLPAEAIALYRGRVDPVAQTWYREGLANRDEKQLLSVVNDFFASSFGDDALMALGEIALEKGHYGAARWHWERLSPLLRSEFGHPVWYALYGMDLDEDWSKIRTQFEKRATPANWLAYPDTDFDLAAIRARLALVSILEGATDRAALELQLLGRLHPQAEGRIVGESGVYYDTLRKLLDEARKWPDRPQRGNWTTFAGSAERTSNPAAKIEFGNRPAWTLRFSDFMKRPARSSGPGASRGGPDNDLAVHPLIVGDLVLLADGSTIFAFDLETGKPAFDSDSSGEIFPAGQLPRDSSQADSIRSSLSEPRYTLTEYDNWLFARMGTQVTVRPSQITSRYEGNRLICLDLEKTGRFEWQYPPIGQESSDFDSMGWAFEGPPIVAGDSVFAALRRSQSRPEAHVVCLDANQRGKLRWRRKICTADTPSHGLQNEMTHNLLTLTDGTIYYNTNLGAVAAISADDGRILWAYQYPRARSGDLSTPPPHFYRDLNPCIYHQGLVIAAPSDSEFIFALDAGTGDLIWRSAPSDTHPIHLLGVGEGSLIATGASVWWFNVVTGRAEYVWPEPGNRAADRGYGRGFLADGHVYWPTREKIYVFGQRVLIENGQRRVEREPPIDLIRGDVPLDQQVTGGNLVIGGDKLLVATAEDLFAFDLYEP